VKVLFCLPAPSIYDNQSRAMSWKHTPIPRQSLKQLKPLVSRLKELGVPKIVSSDLDSDTRHFLAKKLAVPEEEWTQLRRLNVGKLHGLSLDKLQLILNEMELKWNEKPDIPLKGGDSKTSYNKRLAAAQERLTKAQQNTLIIAPAREIGALLHKTVKLEPYHIYESETETLQHSAA
jgi:broad specificity phosphatase PhoE